MAPMKGVDMPLAASKPLPRPRARSDSFLARSRGRGMVFGTRTRVLVVAAAIVAAALPSAATASQLVDRNATGVQLAVNRKGEAMITYRVAGKLKRVLVWGAINARFPSANAHQ